MSKKLLNEIESYREKMIELTATLPLSSEKVISISSKLDDLLNEYEKSKRIK